MKKFKKILKEFKANSQPPYGGGSGSGENDPHKKIKEFMKNTPFTHITTNEDEIHFKDAYDAAKIVADTLANHELGMNHANSVKDRTMTEYFGMSTGTHDDVLRAIEEHIQSHKDLPNELIPHVENVMDEIRKDSKRRASSINMFNKVVNPSKSDNEIGRITYETHKMPSVDGRHPHFLDDTHHLKRVISLVTEDPDRGYFLKKEEYK